MRLYPTNVTHTKSVPEKLNEAAVVIRRDIRNIRKKKVDPSAARNLFFYSAG